MIEMQQSLKAQAIFDSAYTYNLTIERFDILSNLKCKHQNLKYLNIHLLSVTLAVHE